MSSFFIPLPLLLCFFSAEFNSIFSGACPFRGIFSIQRCAKPERLKFQARLKISTCILTTSRRRGGIEKEEEEGKKKKTSVTVYSRINWVLRALLEPEDHVKGVMARRRYVARQFHRSSLNRVDAHQWHCGENKK